MSEQIVRLDLARADEAKTIRNMITAIKTEIIHHSAMINLGI